MPMKRFRLFVYGSLLRGEDNHAFLAAAPGARFLGEDRTKPCFRLVSLGPYPALVRGGAAAVVGEVYEVDEPTLISLDILEDHPDLYCRSTIEVEAFGDVEAYVMTAERAGDAPVLPGGDWRART